VRIVTSNIRERPTKINNSRFDKSLFAKKSGLFPQLSPLSSSIHTKFGIQGDAQEAIHISLLLGTLAFTFHVIDPNNPSIETGIILR
jgi:hypothetical protein